MAGWLALVAKVRGYQVKSVGQRVVAADYHPQRIARRNGDGAGRRVAPAVGRFSAHAGAAHLAGGIEPGGPILARADGGHVEIVVVNGAAEPDRREERARRRLDP